MWKLFVCCFVNSFVGVINVIWCLVFMVDSVVNVVIKVLFEFMLFCIRCIMGCVCCIFFWIFFIIFVWVLVGENGSWVSILLISGWLILIGILGCVLDNLCIFNIFKWCDNNFLRINWYWVGWSFFFILCILIFGGGWWIKWRVLLRLIWLLYIFLGSKLVSVFLFKSFSVWLVKLWRVSCLILFVVG